MAAVLGRKCVNFIARRALLQEQACSGKTNPLKNILFVRNQSSMAAMEFETLKLTQLHEHVLNVELDRPEKLNAMNKQFFIDMKTCFDKIAETSEIRAVVLSGSGRMFTAGLDMMDFAPKFMELSGGSLDSARQAWKVRSLIEELQESFNVIEKCPQPVIAAVHSGCIGGGVDLISACDIRLCSSDAWFQIKEVDIGLAADLGTLQRLPKITGNQSLLRELSYTARKLHSDEAKSFGIVSHIYADKEALMDNAYSMATSIAEKSPVAVAGSKAALNYARDHSVNDGLEQIVSNLKGVIICILRDH